MPAILLLKQFDDMLAQFMNGIPGRIQNMIGDEPNRRKLIPLVRDGIQYRQIGIQGMGAPGFAKPPDKDRVGSLQKPQFGLHTRLGLELFENLRKVLKVFAFANINNDGSLCGFAFRLENQFVELCKQADRQVIDTVESAVFEGPQEGSFSRAA